MRRGSVLCRLDGCPHANVRKIEVYALLFGIVIFCVQVVILILRYHLDPQSCPKLEQLTHPPVHRLGVQVPICPFLSRLSLYNS